MANLNKVTIARSIRTVAAFVGIVFLPSQFMGTNTDVFASSISKST